MYNSNIIYIYINILLYIYNIIMFFLHAFFNVRARDLCLFPGGGDCLFFAWPLLVVLRQALSCQLSLLK